MPNKTFIALFIGYGSGLTGGLLSLLVGFILFSNNFTSDDDIFSTSVICAVLGILADFIGPFILCVIFLLPLAAIDREIIEKKIFVDLLKRYTPLLTMPLGLLFVFILFIIHPNEKYFYLISLLNIFGICFSSFWFFLRKIKSA